MKRTTLKLPPDFLGNVQKFLQTPPPPKKAKKQKAGKPLKKGRS